MMRAFCLLMTLLALMLGGGEARAQRPAARHIAFELLPETSTPRAGGTVTLAIAARPDAGWHGYWSNPGDAGVATVARWTLPPGTRVGALAYPVPQRLIVAGLMNHVYEGPFTLFAELTLPAGLAAGARVPVAVHLDYLVCTDQLCVPESTDLATELTIGDGAIDGAVRARFDRWRQALPRPIGAEATWQSESGAVRLAIPYPAAAPLGDAWFFAATDGVIDYAAPQKIVRDGDRLVIETRAKGQGAPAVLDGVLSTGDGQGLAIAARRGAVPPSAPAGALGAALLAFGGAVLGGLVLNVMPCVFPILSLKALKLAKAGRAEGRREALLYTAGAVVTAMALGGAILVLRAGGASVGWAFQLQDARVVLLLLLLASAITLNLAGLFEFSTPRIAGRLSAEASGAFATGALAAFVATPCAGPFMGAALGAALVLPWPAALAVFGGLGFGLALPFLAIGLIPALQRLLPRPGAWMQTFRRVLAVPMALTALALGWLLWRQSGGQGLFIGLCAAAVLATALWAFGTCQRQGSGFVWGLALLPLAAAAVSVDLVGRLAAMTPRATAGDTPFSEARLAEARARGGPVFVYFTADWCLTCKVNERAAIDTDNVRRAFETGGVTVLVGDWTGGDPTLGRFIAGQGRAGVPLYLWYAPGAAQPEVLPQILTPAMLSDRAARRR